MQRRLASKIRQGSSLAFTLMKPHYNLAETRTPDGARLSLHEHDGSFCIRLNGQDLMHSVTSASEILLGELAADQLATKAPVRVLIGGMGLGSEGFRHRYSPGTAGFRLQLKNIHVCL